MIDAAIDRRWLTEIDPERRATNQVKRNDFYNKWGQGIDLTTATAFAVLDEFLHCRFSYRQ